MTFTVSVICHRAHARICGSASIFTLINAWQSDCVANIAARSSNARLNNLVALRAFGTMNPFQDESRTKMKEYMACAWKTGNN